jgi:diguanylate cyclase (GGDEF)-like protein
MQDKTDQIKDIIEIDDHTLSLKAIEAIAADAKARKHYEREYKNSLYATILKSMTHEIYTEREAESLWNDIVGHMRRLNGILGRNVGVAVASMDYLYNIKSKLSEPKIIEETKSSFIAESTVKDELTGLFLRDVFDVVIRKEIDRAKRNNTPLCLLMIDIDDFKQINDTHGHLKGDDVLRETGAVIDKSVRKMDVAARYGGEELAVIMPDTRIDYACNAGERLRQSIEQHRFDEITVTISIGIAEIDTSIDSAEKLIKIADRALYRAKKEGKNRVRCIDKTGSLNESL